MASPPPIVHNIYQAIVPLAETWTMVLLPFIENMPVERARLRLVSRTHREWDESFVTPLFYQDYYRRAVDAHGRKGLMSLFAFMGWDWLPPQMKYEKNALWDADKPIVVVASRWCDVTDPALFDHVKDLGDRDVPCFEISFWPSNAPYSACRPHANIKVSVGEPLPHDRNSVLYEDIPYIPDWPEPADNDDDNTAVYDTIDTLFAVRRFLRSMPAIFRAEGTCPLADLDRALTLAYGRGLPRAGTPIFDDDDDLDPRLLAGWSEDEEEEEEEGGREDDSADLDQNGD